MVEVCNRRLSAFAYWTGEPVEHVMAMRMTFRQEWMLEVVGGRMCHPDAFHYFSRALIGGNRKRHDFSQPKLAEAIVTCSASAFGSVTVTPMVECQPPTDLNARSKVGLEPRH